MRERNGCKWNTVSRSGWNTKDEGSLDWACIFVSVLPNWSLSFWRFQLDISFNYSLSTKPTQSYTVWELLIELNVRFPNAFRIEQSFSYYTLSFELTFCKNNNNHFSLLLCLYHYKRILHYLMCLDILCECVRCFWFLLVLSSSESSRGNNYHISTIAQRMLRYKTWYFLLFKCMNDEVEVPTPKILLIDLKTFCKNRFPFNICIKNRIVSRKKIEKTRRELLLFHKCTKWNLIKTQYWCRMNSISKKSPLSLKLRKQLCL